jgi:putative ABC transport system permease protein
VGRVKMDGLRQESNRVEGYFPYAQILRSDMTVILKSSSDPSQMMAAVRQQMKEIDPNQPIYNVRTMDEIRGESVAPERLNLTLLSIFAGIALVLAIVGIYGVMSHTVTQRTHEIGIRMAVGAQPRDVFRLVIGQGMILALVGVAFGLAGAFGLTRLMAAMLFGVEPTDPATFAVISILLTLVAVLACYAPSRRATKVDPLVALRYE